MKLWYLYEELTNNYNYPSLYVYRTKAELDYQLSVFNMYKIRAGEISRECAIAAFGLKFVESLEQGKKPMDLKYTIQQPLPTEKNFDELKIGDYFYTSDSYRKAPDDFRNPAIWRKFAVMSNQHNSIALDGSLFPFCQKEKVVQVEPSGEITFLVK